MYEYCLNENEPMTACVDIEKYTQFVRKAALLDLLIAYRRKSKWGVDELVSVAEVVAGCPIELKTTDVMPDSGADTKAPTSEPPAEKVSDDA